MKEKEETMLVIQKLEDENAKYKEKLGEFSLTVGSIQGERIHESLRKIREYIAGLVDSFEKVN